MIFVGGGLLCLDQCILQYKFECIALKKALAVSKVFPGIVNVYGWVAKGGDTPETLKISWRVLGVEVNPTGVSNSLVKAWGTTFKMDKTMGKSKGEDILMMEDGSVFL